MQSFKDLGLIVSELKKKKKKPTVKLKKNIKKIPKRGTMSFNSLEHVRQTEVVVYS